VWFLLQFENACQPMRRKYILKTLQTRMVCKFMCSGMQHCAVGCEALDNGKGCTTVLLTLSVPAEYMYSAASHASRPDGVLVLRDFHNVVK
jgi:hypothetical protein